MNGNISLIPTLVLCILIKKTVCSCGVIANTGIIDPNCEGCACCRDRDCGPEGYFSEGNCYKGCIDGYRGARCIRKCDYTECTECPDCAYVCTKCNSGYYPGPGSNCSSKCPIGCKSCTSSTYCTECMNEYYNDNGFEDCRYRYCPVHCKCEQKTCVSCEDGYYNISASCISQCPPTCVTCSSNDICSSCRGGNYNGYEFDITDQLLLNNCTHKCRENCITCSSYDNCSQCVAGKYGITCQNDCSVGCENKICEILSGKCYCKANFTGFSCTECVLGRYGVSCEKSCPIFCKNTRCDKASGNCLDGCIVSPIVGETCNACVKGSYGDKCNTTCPTNCKDSYCVRESGDCSYGCKANFSGKRCEACINGRYGESCSLLCLRNCAEGKCNIMSGLCLACSGNYYGNKCNDCATGYFWQTCNEHCSSNCLAGVCNRDTGKCDLGCKGNYSGDRCCVESGSCIECSSNYECSKCKSGYFGDKCNELCSPNWSNSCDIETGVCYSCRTNLFGIFCNTSCPLSCKMSPNPDVHRCEPKHGNCIHGCVDGYFGPLCDKYCSSQCIDNVCMLVGGKCSRGCYRPSDDPVCHLSSENQSSVDSKQTIVIAFGVVVAILLVVVICLIAYVIVLKRHSIVRSDKSTRVCSENETPYSNIENRRNEENMSTDQNSVYYNVMENNDESSRISKTNDFEKLESDQDQEHDYGQIRSVS